MPLRRHLVATLLLTVLSVACAPPLVLTAAVEEGPGDALLALRWQLPPDEIAAVTEGVEERNERFTLPVAPPPESAMGAVQDHEAGALLVLVDRAGSIVATSDTAVFFLEEGNAAGRSEGFLVQSFQEDEECLAEVGQCQVECRAGDDCACDADCTIIVEHDPEELLELVMR